MTITTEEWIRWRIDKKKACKISDVVEELGVSRQNVYRVIDKSDDFVVMGGVIMQTRNKRFLTQLMSFGVSFDGDMLNKAIQFTQREDFDPSSVFGEKFTVDADGIGILRIIQALVVAMSCDLAFTMLLELD